MSLCDCRGLFANDKEVARRRSGAASRGNDAVIHKKPRHKQRAASLLACESLTQSKRADELINDSLNICIKNKI